MGIVRILASLSLRVSSHWTIAQAKLFFDVLPSILLVTTNLKLDSLNSRFRIYM